MYTLARNMHILDKVARVIFIQMQRLQMLVLICTLYSQVSEPALHISMASQQ